LYCSTKISSFSFVKAIIATAPGCFTSSLLLVLPLGKLTSSTCRLTTLPSKILFVFNVFSSNFFIYTLFFYFFSFSLVFFYILLFILFFYHLVNLLCQLVF